MQSSRILTVASLSSGRAFASVIAAAVLVRSVVWMVLDGPIIRGDGVLYVEWARAIASRDMSGFIDFPLHQMYPILLAPAFVTGAPLEPYLFTLHTSLSVATVACLYFACRRSMPALVAVGTAVIAAWYPSTLFWYPYVLSETPFFFFLSLFLLSLAVVLSTNRVGLAAIAFFVVAGLLMALSRPVSIGVLAVGIAAGTYAILARRVDRRRACIATTAGIVVLCVLMVGVFASETPLRDKLLRYPTVAQSLWLSTRLSSSSFAEWAVVRAEQDALVTRFAGNQDALWGHKVREATEFIRSRPVDYAVLAARRFTSFWIPSLFSDGWSALHRAFDLGLILSLFIGAAISLYGRRDSMRWSLFATALAFGALVSFSQIDTDGRYRVPAEIALIPLAADGYIRFSARVVRPKLCPDGPESH